MTRKQQHHPRKRDGYVLLMTLAVILICTVLLVGLAQLSLSHVTSSKLLARDIQAKWGAASCSRIALARQSELLNRRIWDDNVAQWIRRPVRESQNIVQLGNQRFVLDLIDESAKLDVNFLLKQKSKQEAEQIIGSLIGYDTPIELRPLSKTRDQKEDPIEAWGQVFVYDEFSWPDANVIRQSTNEITCWSRKLNFHTASDEALFEASKAMVGSATATKLQKARQASPNTSLREIKQELSLIERHEIALRSFLTESSQTQAIWISISSGAHRETNLHVQETIVDGVQRVHSFAW